jgi:hypothetical protein
MGTQRNGARGALNLIAKACKLSRTPGWRIGIVNILGATEAADFFAVWDPFCAVVDLAIGADNFFNQIDYQEEVSGSEDNPIGGPS